MIAFVRRHWLVVSAAAAVLAGLAVIALIWFQPQRLLYDDTVHEALPTPVATVPMAMTGLPHRAAENAPSPAPAPTLRVLSDGEFGSRGHHGSGNARVLDLGAGQLVLRLESFSTENGPDLRVYLSPATPDAPNDQLNDGATSLGHLKGNKGDQNYSIPAELRLSDYRSVVIWCKRFSYAFTTAPLG